MRARVDHVARLIRLLAAVAVAAGLVLAAVVLLLLLLPRLEDWLALAGGLPPSVWLQGLMLAPTLGLAGLAVVLAAVN